MIAFGLLPAVQSGAGAAHSWRQPRARSVSRILVAVKLAALFSLPPVIAAWMLKRPGDPAAWSSVLLATVAIAFGLAIGQLIVRGPSVVERRAARVILAKGSGRGRIIVLQIAMTVALMLAPALIWADAPRPLDLAGARLFAREPSEGLMAGVIAATPRQASDKPGRATALSDAQLEAWEAFGLGVDLSGWNFPRVSFQGASMQKINLSNADLKIRANLIRANLAGANLTHATLGGATLVEADLRKAELRDMRLVATRLFRAKQRMQNRPSISPVPTSPEPTSRVRGYRAPI